MPSKRASPADLPAVEQVATRLHSAAIQLLRRLRREDDASGLTAPRLSVLSFVVFAGPRTLGELAAAEQVKPPTMTRLVAALERQKLVRRIPDDEDGRVTRIAPTEKGRALLLRGRGRRVAALTRALEGLRTEELRTIDEAVNLIEAIVHRA